jgi:NAD(P)-dependent dehydrogenase (short-subunit alcohol dehydrogenase family)
MLLQHKVVVITGAASVRGMGRATPSTAPVWQSWM